MWTSGFNEFTLLRMLLGIHVIIMVQIYCSHQPLDEKLVLFLKPWSQIPPPHHVQENGPRNQMTTRSGRGLL